MKTLPRRKFFSVAALTALFSGIGLWFKPRTKTLKYDFLFRVAGPTEFYVGGGDPILPPKGTSRHYLNGVSGNLFEFHGGKWSQLEPNKKPTGDLFFPHKDRLKDSVIDYCRRDPEEAKKLWMSDIPSFEPSCYYVQVLCPMVTSRGEYFEAWLQQEHIDHPAVSGLLSQFFHGGEFKVPGDDMKVKPWTRIVQCIPRNHVDAVVNHPANKNDFIQFKNLPVVQVDLDADAIWDIQMKPHLENWSKGPNPT